MIWASMMLDTESRLAGSCLRRSVRSLIDRKLISGRRVQLSDQAIARERLQVEIALGSFHGFGVPIRVEAVDGDSRILDRVAVAEG